MAPCGTGQRGRQDEILPRRGARYGAWVECGDEEDTLEKYKKEVLPAFGKSF